MNSPFEKRICFTICICQMIAVLSCVSIVYLTVAVYKPSYQAISSGILEDRVMCTTIQNFTPIDCDKFDGRINEENWKGWNSCSEWCLSKSSGNCPRIYVDVRVNGSDLRLEGCETVDWIECRGLDRKAKQHECVEDDCNGMDGFFNCTTPIEIAGVTSEIGSRCTNLTAVATCIYDESVTYNETTCEKKEKCLKLNGTYHCRTGNCKQLDSSIGSYSCHKVCTGIKVGNKNVIVREGDRIFTAVCQRAINVSGGEETAIWPLENHMSKADAEVPKTLLIFCTNMYNLTESNKTFEMSDCVNGTLLEPNYFGETTEIIKLIQTHADFLDAGTSNREDLLIGPPESDLLIWNDTRLFINYESCVNTLILDECAQFYADYGEDGANLWSNSRFPCYYAPDNPDFVTLRFSRLKTMKQLMLCTSIPMTLALLSCCSLFICSKIIGIGDDSHFYLRLCGDKEPGKQEILEVGTTMAL